MLKEWDYGRLQAEANYVGGDLIKKAAAIAILHEIDQAHDDDIAERHHKDILDQNDKHHREDLDQQRELFSKSNRVAWFAAWISTIAAVAAIGSAWYAHVQTATLQPAPIQQPVMQPQTPPKAPLSVLPSGERSQSLTSLHVSGSPTETLTPAPQQSASAPPVAK